MRAFERRHDGALRGVERGPVDDLLARQEDDLPVDQLCAAADALIVAVPPAEAPAVVAAADGRVEAILVESPTATTIADAAALGVSAGDGVVAGDALATLAVRVDYSLAEGCAAYPAGLSGTENLHLGGHHGHQKDRQVTKVPQSRT